MDRKYSPIEAEEQKGGEGGEERTAEFKWKQRRKEE